MDKMTSGLILGVVVGLLLGVAGTWIYFDQNQRVAGGEEEREESDRPTPTPSPTPTPGRAPAPTNESPNARNSGLSAQDQVAGITAVITSVRIETDGWAVIYESRSGQPGNALGAARLSAGFHNLVVVPLLRGTIGGETYFAVLHRDDGDKVFELKDDFPLRTEDGPIIVTFRTFAGSGE